MVTSYIQPNNMDRYDQRYSRNHCKAHKGKRKTNGMNNSSTLPFPNVNFIHYI